MITRVVRLALALALVAPLLLAVPGEATPQQGVRSCSTIFYDGAAFATTASPFCIQGNGQPSQEVAHVYACDDGDVWFNAYGWAPVGDPFTRHAPGVLMPPAAVLDGCVSGGLHYYRS